MRRWGWVRRLERSRAQVRGCCERSTEGEGNRISDKWNIQWR